MNSTKMNCRILRHHILLSMTKVHIYLLHAQMQMENLHILSSHQNSSLLTSPFLFQLFAFVLYMITKIIPVTYFLLHWIITVTLIYLKSCIVHEHNAIWYSHFVLLITFREIKKTKGFIWVLPLPRRFCYQ